MEKKKKTLQDIWEDTIVFIIMHMVNNIKCIWLKYLITLRQTSIGIHTKYRDKYYSNTHMITVEKNNGTCTLDNVETPPILQLWLWD